MMDYEEYDPMEYEYTSPIQITSPRYYRPPQEIYVPPSTGSFPIPESFFEKQYNKTTSVANKVADALMSFSISDPEEQEEKSSSESSESAQEEEEDPKINSVNNALTLYSPPNSPRRPVQEAMSSNHSTYNTSASVDQNVTPNSPNSSSSISSNSSTSSFASTAPTVSHYISPEASESSWFSLNPTPNYNPSFIHSPHYQPAYIYHYPEPANPVDESKGKMHVIQGLFRLSVITIVFTAVSYTLFYVGQDLSRDVMEKVNHYESEFFAKQMSCRDSYENNRCSSDPRFPAIMEMCQEWERCMYSPIITRRSKALAETVADMANGFSENLTPKTMIMCVAIGLMMVWGLVKVLMGHPTPAPLPTPLERKDTNRNSKFEPLRFEEGSPFI